jgi:hypothetical protein
MKYKYTSTQEIEKIIKSLKSKKLMVMMEFQPESLNGAPHL